MQKVSTQNRAGHLNALELIKDYGRKLNTATAVGFVDHYQDDDGCATLVIHVVGPKVEEAKSLGDCLEQLKRVTASVEELLPKPEVAVVKKSRGKANVTDPAESQIEEASPDEQEQKPAD